LGEIESCLVKLENIKEAIVIDREDTNGEKYLCAYIICRKEPDTEAIKKELARILPYFMIPAYFIPLTGIPLNPNGKVDRRALPAPELKAGEDFIEPSTPTQKMLTEIWAGVLNLPKEKISCHADFFQLGGHSLKAAVMAEKIHKDIHISIPLNKIFENPKLDALASFIDLIQLKEKLTHNIDTPNTDTTDTTREEFII
jgi:acyl carrier protein